MERDVTRQDTISAKLDRDDDVLKHLERVAELPVRRHRRREYPADER